MQIKETMVAMARQSVSAVNQKEVGEPMTWTRQQLEEYLTQIGLQRGSGSSRDYGKAMRIVRSFYSPYWVPDYSKYCQLNEWIRDYFGLAS